MQESRLKGTIAAAVTVAFVLALSLTLQFLLGTPKGLRLVPSGITVFVLITINTLLAAIFVLLIGRILIKLWMQKKKGLPGASFSVKLVTSVLLTTTVPALLLFFISAGFISKSVEVWFSERREQAIENMVEVAREYTRLLESKARMVARGVVRRMRGKAPPSRNDLKAIARAYGAKIIEVYDKEGRLLATTESKRTRSLFKEVDFPSSVRDAAKEGTPMGFLHKRYYCYLLPEPSKGVVILVVQKLPKKVSEALAGINASYKEYSSLKLIKESAKNTYIAILLMVSALIIFSSAWYALQIAKSVTGPLEALFNATKEVSSGNLSVRIEADTKDELGNLIRSFNRMIMELDANRAEIEERKAFIETVVENVATGVVSIDGSGNITTINTSARNILGVDEGVLNKKYWQAFPKDRFGPIYTIIREMLKSPSPGEKREITLYVNGSPKHLLVGASPLKDKEGRWAGTVIVLEDITDLVKAQRAQAWEEVARRMAHEIKNPLTPIRLCAQRIKRKLSKHRLEETEALEKSADSIIKASETIKRMVDEFSRFARLPEIELSPSDPKELIKEVVEMYKEHTNVDFKLVFSENLPKRMLLDREQMKRVLMNLIDNAIYAMNGSGTITISCRYDKERSRVVMEVADTGCGIPDEDKEKLFQPYFSKRKGGTGLGLAIVDRIVADHGGYVRVADNHPRGAVFIIEIPYREAA